MAPIMHGGRLDDAVGRGGIGKTYFICDLVCDKLMKLVKCAGMHNSADALTKSLPSPSYELHMPHMSETIFPYDSGMKA